VRDLPVSARQSLRGGTLTRANQAICSRLFISGIIGGMSTKKKRTSAPVSPAPPPAPPLQADGSPNLEHIAEGLRPLAVPVGDLLFDPANARKHDEASVSAIAASLRVYGQCKPVVARRDNGVVIAGNGTLQAALSLGWTHLAAVKVDFDGATAAGFSISDNRTAELSSWEKEALDKLLREVSTDNDPRLDEMMADLAKSNGLYLTGEEEKDEAGDPQMDTSASLEEKFQILIECSGEAEQAELLDRFTAEGVTCRALIV